MAISPGFDYNSVTSLHFDLAFGRFNYNLMSSSFQIQLSRAAAGRSLASAYLFAYSH